MISQPFEKCFVTALADLEELVFGPRVLCLITMQFAIDIIILSKPYLL